MVSRRRQSAVRSPPVGRLQAGLSSGSPIARQPTFSSHDPLLDARAAVTLDLHGRTEAEARAAVEKLVKSSSGKLVHVITGKGKGSAGGPVLKTMVRGMLKGSLAPLVRDWSPDSGDGGYRILLR